MPFVADSSAWHHSVNQISGVPSVRPDFIFEAYCLVAEPQQAMGAAAGRLETHPNNTPTKGVSDFNLDFSITIECTVQN